jgi:hypothetical protein
MATGSEVARLFVTVGADITGMTVGMNSASAKLQAVGKEMMSTGPAMTAALSVPLLKAGRDMVDTAATFEAQMKVIGGTLENMGVSISGWFGALIGGAVPWGSGLLALLKSPFEGLLQFVKNLHIPLPRFTVEWQEVMGVRLPKGVSVKWYGSGLDAVFNTPTLIGVGERGAERVTVTPLHRDKGGSGGEVTGALDLNLKMEVNQRRLQTLHERLEVGRRNDAALRTLAVLA